VLNSLASRIAVGSLVLTLGAFGGSATAPDAISAEFMHLALKRSDPARDSVLTKAPTAITLWFTQKPEMAVTMISMTDASAAKVELANPRSDAADETVVIADIKGALRPGAYHVSWRTSSHDGHAIRGEFSFTIRSSK